MKKCPKHNLEFPDDRRFCSVCGSTLVGEFESATLILPKMKLKRAEFIEMNNDGIFKLIIHNNVYRLSLDEVKTLGDEIHELLKQQISKPQLRETDIFG